MQSAKTNQSNEVELSTGRYKIQSRMQLVAAASTQGYQEESKQSKHFMIDGNSNLRQSQKMDGDNKPYLKKPIQTKSRSKASKSTRPNFLMMKEKAIMDQAKVLDMALDYNSQQQKPGKDLNVSAFRMPTPTHQDTTKIMAGDFISNRQSEHTYLQSNKNPKSIQSAQPVGQKKYSIERNMAQ